MVCFWTVGQKVYLEEAYVLFLPLWESARLAAKRVAHLSGPLRLRVQSRSRPRLRIAASIAFLFRACFTGVFRHYSATIARLSPLSGLEQGG